MFRKSTPKVKDELVLIFDIGSSSVGGAFFAMQDSGIPKIIYSLREEILVTPIVDVDKFLISTLESLKTVVKKIHDQSFGKPDKIYCVLSSPWHISQTRLIKLEKNSNFIFTSKLADELIKKEVALFEEERASEYDSLTGGERTIELKNIKTSLNGYETINPLNKEAKSLEMTVFVSISPEEILKKIEDSILKFFNITELKFISSSLASFILVRDLFTDQRNFLLIDIGGELTDIEMTKKDILRESISFPLGSNFIIRGVSKSLSCSIEEAKSFLSLYRDNHASPEVKSKIENIINTLKTEWLKKFQESLANISNDISIPASIYIIVDREWASFFAELIKSEQFNQYTLAESKFEITVLNTEVLHGIASFEDNVIRDPFLIIGAVYINRHMNKNHV
jgi:cell division ATPase FtsA